MRTTCCLPLSLALHSLLVRPVPNSPAPALSPPAERDSPAEMSDFEVSAEEFRALYDRVKQMSQRGPADRLGALNNISPAQVVAAASDVRRGRVVSLAAPIDSEAAPDNPDPAVHQMTHTGISSGPASGLSFAMDRVALDIHGNADS